MIFAVIASFEWQYAAALGRDHSPMSDRTCNDSGSQEDRAQIVGNQIPDEPQRQKQNDR
jgi:hypothetical protein